MPRKQTQPVNFRLTTEALNILDFIAEKQGISKTAILEILIRESIRTGGRFATEHIQ